MSPLEFKASMNAIAGKYVAIGEKFQRRWRRASLCYSFAAIGFSLLVFSYPPFLPTSVMCLYWAFHARWMAIKTFQDSLKHRQIAMDDMRETLNDNGYESL